MAHKFPHPKDLYYLMEFEYYNPFDEQYNASTTVRFADLPRINERLTRAYQQINVSKDYFKVIIRIFKRFDVDSGFILLHVLEINKGDLAAPQIGEKQNACN